MGIFDFFKTKNSKIDVFAYSDKFFDKGNYHEAIRVLDIAIETEPSNWYSFFKKGKCYQYLNDFSKAIEIYKKGQKIEDNFDLNRGLGECYLMTEQWQSGKNALLKTYSLLLDLEKGPSSNIVNKKIIPNDKANILNNLAIAVYNLNEIEDAIKYSEDGIKFDPNFAGNYRILGIILLDYDNLKGIKLLKQAASLGDEMAKTILNDLL
jgi:tetratricopeptide (TPR) repeat protein